MWRRFSPFALVLPLAALAAPASHASARMCLGHERCGITRAYVPPVRAASSSYSFTGLGHEGSGLTGTERGPRVVVVPMRSDGSQHGGI
jgi:hypothetical protein